jgi:hypothetical protein
LVALSKTRKNKPNLSKDFHYNHGYGIRFSKEIDTKPTKFVFQKPHIQCFKKKNKKGLI